MFRKTSRLLVYAIAMLIPLTIGTMVVMAKPAQQTSYRYDFVGQVTDAERARAVPGLDIQIACNGAATTTVKCDPAGNWSGTLNLPVAVATCDIQLMNFFT